jgi:hypothetical protein
MKESNSQLGKMIFLSEKVSCGLRESIFLCRKVIFNMSKLVFALQKAI